MWQFPWSYAESFAFSAGLAIAGAGVQIASNTIMHLPSYPVNIVLLFVFVLALVCCGVFGKKNSIVKWLSSIPAALSAIALFTVLSLLMGFITQSNLAYPIDVLSNIKYSWMYGFAQIYILTTLGLTIIRRLKFRKKNIGFIINHFGLWTILAAASFGAGDIQRYTMRVNEGNVEWIGANQSGTMKELPIAIMLHDFSLEYYPAEIGVWDTKDETMLKALSFVLNDGDSVFYWKQYTFRVTTKLDHAWMMSDDFREAPAPGAVVAAWVDVFPVGNDTIGGWVSQGSSLQNPTLLPFSDGLELIMKPPKPKLYKSDVTVYSKNGTVVEKSIMVNQPVSVEGWTIYQYGYDESMGEWSTESVFELVKDPWLNVIYFGLSLLMIGSVFMFVIGAKKTKNDLQ